MREDKLVRVLPQREQPISNQLIKQSYGDVAGQMIVANAGAPHAGIFWTRANAVSALSVRNPHQGLDCVGDILVR